MPSILIKSLSQVSRNANTNFGFIKSSGFSSKSDLSGELYHIGSFYAVTIIELPFHQKDYFEVIKNFLKK